MNILERYVSKPVLSCLESVYRFAEDLHYRYHHWNARAIKNVKAWVICVGNITWGGTGKTPTVIMLARHLAADGKRVCILTRGYGNDESFELRKSLEDIPVLIGRDRVQLARKAIAEHRPDILIMDDGFQHLRLHRDCDVVTINATNPFGNQHLIPKGVLREPMQRLSRADVFVLTQSFLGKRNLLWIRQKLREVNRDAPIFEADHRPIYVRDILAGRRLPLTYLKEKSVATLSGVEDPISFERTIERLGAWIRYSARFRDHYNFREADIREVLRACDEVGIRYLITTEKDSYRLEANLGRFRSSQVTFLVLHIEMRLDDEEGFVQHCQAQRKNVEQAPA